MSNIKGTGWAHHSRWQATTQTLTQPPSPLHAGSSNKGLQSSKGRPYVSEMDPSELVPFFSSPVWPTAALAVMRCRQRAISKIEKDFISKTLLICKICAEENHSAEEPWWCRWFVLICNTDNAMRNVGSSSVNRGVGWEVEGSCFKTRFGQTVDSGLHSPICS